MCCIQISSEILLENVLGSEKVQSRQNGRVSFKDIENCGIFLENNLPGYVNCNVNRDIMCRLARNYGCTIEDDAIINLTNVRDIKRRNERFYPLEIANRIESIVDAFWQQRNDERDVVRMKRIIVK